MEGGAVHGEGMKGRVIDYGTLTEDLESLEHIKLDNVTKVNVYILEKEDIIEYEKGPEIIDELIHLDKNQNYVVKEFTIPNLATRTFGQSKKTYMMREIDGFKHILPVVKKYGIVGIPYKNNTLIGFEIVMKNKGLFDRSNSRCFIVNIKCTQTMSELIVNKFTEQEFVQFVDNILSTLVDIQNLDVAHGDIKLDNIMKCRDKYELIDWENNRLLEYKILIKNRYFGLSPIYFKILYGTAWYPAFKVALLKYYKETGGYDTEVSSEYANNIIEHYKQWFDKYTLEETFESVKYSLDLCPLGMILYGILQRNENIKNIHKEFIMNLYKMKNASVALKEFRKYNHIRKSKHRIHKKNKTRKK
jgi:serine/threonine protein kinase